MRDMTQHYEAEDNEWRPGISCTEYVRVLSKKAADQGISQNLNYKTRQLARFVHAGGGKVTVILQDQFAKELRREKSYKEKHDRIEASRERRRKQQEESEAQAVTAPSRDQDNKGRALAHYREYRRRTGILHRWSTNTPKLYHCLACGWWWAKPSPMRSVSCPSCKGTHCRVVILSRR